MGVRESVGELEAAMSELEGSAAAKAKKTRETAVREDRLGGMEVRIGDIEGGIAELRENIGALQKKFSMLETAKEKSGAGGYAAIEKRIRELESRAASARPPATGKDYSADIAELKKSVSEIRNGIASVSRSGEPAKAPAKDLLELKSRMDVLQKYVEGRMDALQAPQEQKGKAMEGAINSRLNELSRKIDEISKYGPGKMSAVPDADRSIEEKLKLFALNSDVEKVWKEAESLRKYIDEKSRYADGLANSLRAWETRSLELAAREHDFDEKIKAFPELKLLDSRIRKMERAIADLQRHFVAAKMAEPIIME